VGKAITDPGHSDLRGFGGDPLRHGLIDRLRKMGFVRAPVSTGERYPSL
jgi:hypothetical protein